MKTAVLFLRIFSTKQNGSQATLLHGIDPWVQRTLLQLPSFQLQKRSRMSHVIWSDTKSCKYSLYMFILDSSYTHCLQFMLLTLLFECAHDQLENDGRPWFSTSFNLFCSPFSFHNIDSKLLEAGESHLLRRTLQDGNGIQIYKTNIVQCYSKQNAQECTLTNCLELTVSCFNHTRIPRNAWHDVTDMTLIWQNMYMSHVFCEFC